MKNLKKVLSLALAFAMVLGLCIGASAADVTSLNDWDEVENQDAATLLGAFDIMKGDDEGNFRPNDNVTRAETAKMISVALWGGSDDVALYNAGNIGGYTDVVSGAWYMGYVNYMTVQSIVTGKGEGVFDPNGNVTGYELLKMCLVSLGYSPEVEHLTGAGWDVRTMALATKPGFQNLTAKTSVTNWNAPLSRTNAAQIIANMIYRNTVTYSLTNGVGGNVSSMVTPSTKTFAESVLGMSATKGTLVANEFGTIVTVADATESLTSVKPINKGRGYADQNAIVQTTKDNDTKTAKVLDKNWQLKLDSTALDLGATVSMYIVNGQVISATVNAPAEVEPIFSKETGNALTNGEKADGTCPLYIKNGVAYDMDNGSLSGFGAYTVDEKGKMTVSGTAEVKFLDTNGNGYIDIITANVFTANETVKKTGEDKTGEYFEYGASNTKVYNTTVDAIPEKGDEIYIASMTQNCFGNASATNAKNHVVVLDTVEGAITRYGTGLVWVDGVKYATSGVDYTATDAAKGAGTFFFNLKGEVVKFSAAEGNTGADTYAVIFDRGVAVAQKQGSLSTTSVETLRVSAILEDGTVGAYDVASVSTDGTEANTTKTFEVDDVADTVLSGAANSGATDGNNYLVTYTINNDKQLVITKVIGVIGADGIDASDFGGTVKVGTKYLTANTIGFLQTAAPTATATDKWAVTKGTALATAIDKEAAGKVTAVYSQLFDATNKNDGIAVMAAETTEVKTDNTTTADLYYALSVQTASTDATGTTTYYVTAYNSKSNKVEELSYKQDNATVAPGKLYTSFNENGTGLGGEIASDLVKKGYVQAKADGIVNIAMNGSTAAYLTNDKTKCYLIDAEDTENCKAITLADVVEQTVPETIGTTFQVIVVLNDTDATAAVAAGDTATMIIVIAE